MNNPSKNYLAIGGYIITNEGNVIDISFAMDIMKQFYEETLL